MRIKNFLFQSFAQVFFPIFFVLFFIASVVIFIRISGLTFIIKISFLELLTLYFYTLPTMLFFVIPISFFVACVLGLSRLSFDYELPVLFALGMSPKKIIMIFLPIATLASISLFMLSLVLTPLSDIAYRQFLEERKNSIDINLKPGEFGQKLGDWLVYAQRGKDSTYENIVLLSLQKEDNQKEGLVFAAEANISNADGVMEAHLRDGKIYRKVSDGIERISFETMILRTSLDFIGDDNMSLIEYWKRAFYENPREDKTKRNLSMYVLLSLFPFVSLFYFPLLGVKNPRYQKNYTVLQTMGVVGVFFTLMYLAATYFPLLGMFFVPIFWGCIGYALYYRYIARFY